MPGIEWLAGGALIGLLASSWSYIKSFIWKIISLFIQRVEIQDAYLNNMVLDYMMSQWQLCKIYDRAFNACHAKVKSLGSYHVNVPYEMFADRSLIFWKGWLPVFYSFHAKPNKDNSNSTPVGSGKESIVYTYIKGTLDFNDLLTKSAVQRFSRMYEHTVQSENNQSRFAIHHIPPAEEKNKAQKAEKGEYLNDKPWYTYPRYRLIGFKPEDLGEEEQDVNALDLLIFPQRVKDLINEIKLWHANREWYRARNIPWKRGWLLYGPGGCGKTCLARAFAEDLGLPIFVYNLAELNNRTFRRYWATMQTCAPCIALIEDIDNIFHGRQSVTQRSIPAFSAWFGPKKKPSEDNSNKLSPKTDDDDDDFSGDFGFGQLTFDCLLNVLDGIDKNEGVFTIITTNDITKIDEALGKPRQLADGSIEVISTRPGRIDKAIELTYMECQDKHTMAEKILCDFPEELIKMKKFIDDNACLKETPAQMQDRCAQIALKCFWEQQHPQKVLN